MGEAMGQADATDTERDHPRHLSDVTAGWLTARLRAAGTDAQVAAFTPKLIGDGVGLMATLHRLTLEYSNGSGPESLVVKFPGEIEANRVIAAQFGLFRREVEFYRVAASRTTMALPRIYAAEIDPDDSFVLLMEDLRGMHTGDQVAGIAGAEAGEAIDELVKLHAPFWGKVDTGEYDFAPRVDGPGQADGMHAIAVASWDSMNAQFGDAVPERMNAIRDRFLDAIPAMHAWLGSAPTTLIHSDYRLDNLMLGADPAHPAVVTLDWQGVLRSRGIEDVAFLLSQSVPAEKRGAAERDLVERWRRGLVAAGIDHYTPESAWHEYRKCVLYLWMYAVIISGALDPTNPRSRMVMRAIITRSAAAVDELDCLALLGEFE
jgi:aminoglycoside phosphotransferase (APT) family kinase protein